MKKLKIAVVHNFYRHRGGEDSVVERECALLESAGHEVHRFFRHSTIEASAGGLNKALRTAMELPHSSTVYREFRSFLKKNAIDLAHFHNTFPFITPSAIEAAYDLNVPSVMTAHNFRFICANGLMLREQHPCEKCVQGTPLWGLVHACYRDSRVATAPLTRLIYKYRKGVELVERLTTLVTLSEFARDKFIEAGARPEKIVTKPNFAEDPGQPVPWAHRKKHALFVGRLSEEKGILHLLRAWSSLEIPLKIIGGGPLETEVRALAPKSVTLLGSLPADRVREEMQQAKLLIIPSVAYENFPLVLVESWSNGLPVLAHHNGSLAGLIAGGETGLFFPDLSPKSIGTGVESAFSEEVMLERISHRCREHYLEHFTRKAALTSLESIYRNAIAPR